MTWRYGVPESAQAPTACAADDGRGPSRHQMMMACFRQPVLCVVVRVDRPHVHDKFEMLTGMVHFGTLNGQPTVMIQASHGPCTCKTV